MLKNLVLQEKRLEDEFRRYGVEGEDAFYLLAYQYLVYFSDMVHYPPERIMKKGRRAFDKIRQDTHLIKHINSLITSDPKAETLPIWYQHFLGRKFREGSGKFFTPHPVARAMAALIPLKEDAIIMDPTCGGGTFLMEASNRWSNLNCSLVANDIETSLVDLAQIILFLGTPRQHGKIFLNTNIFEPNSQFQDWYGRVDYILANPPFSLQINNIVVESKLYNIGYRNSDALFLDICLNLLRERGRLICLLPHSVIANTEFQKFRLAVEESWNLLGVIGLPEGVFYLTANTTTRADIVILEKRENEHKQISKLVFAFAPTVGIPLSSRMMDEKTNYLERIVNDPNLTDYYV